MEPSEPTQQLGTRAKILAIVWLSASFGKHRCISEIRYLDSVVGIGTLQTEEKTKTTTKAIKLKTGNQTYSKKFSPAFSLRRSTFHRFCHHHVTSEEYRKENGFLRCLDNQP